MNGDCHCFCQVAHPYAEGVCDGDAVGERPVNSALLGVVQVPMCGPCRAALPIRGEVLADEQVERVGERGELPG
ncbi:hypothetical protein ACIBG8_54385 [Nonomuraea sp. NPDC050556]|uniref:hypothetical protein n=1 Tax=Nonomuraea sp. NPDC050556 TaxID=3364369 RepID=UPI00379581F1